MENISNVIYRPEDWESNVEKLLSLAEKAKAHSSFFGAEYLTVEGYSGSLHIDAFARRLYEIVDYKTTFTISERKAASKLYNRIVTLYDEMQDDLRYRNILTQFLASIRHALNIY